VLSRALTSDAPEEIQFANQDSADSRRAVAGSIPVAIHIWDGLAGETDSRIAISSWIHLKFDEPIRAWYFAAAGAGAVLVLMVAWITVRRIRRVAPR
jgi:hypothetical protein